MANSPLRKGFSGQGPGVSKKLSAVGDQLVAKDKDLSDIGLY
jgi:hypothetical protein